MKLDVAELKIQEALEKNQVILIAGRCSVSYSGRAESFLEEGDRVFLIKQDGTLLVHQPTGNNPVNYMKEKTKHDVFVEDGKLILKSSNLALKEYLDVEITKVHFVESANLDDNKKILIKGTEFDMAEMIMEKPELIERGFKPLNREEHTKYGFIDVFGYDKDKCLTIVECKRYIGDLKAVSQLRRYVEKIKKSKGIDKVRGILACPTMSENAKKMLEDWGFKHVSVSPPKYLERYNKNQKNLGEY